MAIHTSRRNPLGPASHSNATIASLIGGIDWAKTPVGPRSAWPQSLRTSLSITMDSRFPMVVMWGSELVLFYNASYAPILGEKHPWAMGRPMREVWPEIWETIGPMLRGVMETGVATYSEDLLLPLFRNGYLEECYLTFSYSPIADRNKVCGVFCAVAETSRKVLAERRLRTLHELEARAFGATDVDQACLVTAQVLARNQLDVPFSRIYLFDENERLRLRESSGPPASEREDWPIEEAAQTLAARVVSSTIESTSTLVQSSPVHSAIVLPIAAAGQTQALGAIVLGLSPFSVIDQEYRHFLELTAGQIAAAVQSAQAYQEAKSRAEALAHLDRARTAFFSNISHEFRAPLTLLLGPIERLLQDVHGDLDPQAREELQMARRNAYRLLKIVNQLLEFSRIEANRTDASYEAVEVAIAERARDAAVENERILRMLADAIPQIVCTAGPRGVIDYFNRCWFEFTGLTEEQSLRKGGWRQAIHPDDRPTLESHMREAAESGNDFSLEFRLRSRTGEHRWFLARAVALRDDEKRVIRFFSTATDIDEQKRSEERETFLSRVSDELASTLDARAILQKITELCIPTFCDWCQVSSLSAEDELIVEAVSHIDPRLRERLQSLVGRHVIDVSNVALGSTQVLSEAESRVLDHAMTLRAVAENVPDPEDRATYEAAGLGTVAIVPLVVRGRVRGTLHLVNIDPMSRRLERALEIAEELGRRAAVAIDNSRLYEREHRVASALQRAMLPAYLPSHPRVELSYAYRPAERESRVGGDWYDAFLVSDNRVAISIGDVGGHGLEAAVAMNEARQAIRLSALEGMTPAQTLRRTNAALMLNDEHPIITAVFGVIDVERSILRYSCAGHPPPAVAPLQGRAHYLEGGGIPLGVDVAAPFPTLEFPLDQYATLLFYTDGLIEYNRNIERECARLLDALSARVQDFTADGAGALVRNLLDNRQLDDIAVLAATFLPARPNPVALRLPAAPSSAAIARRLAMRFARVAKLAQARTFDLTIAVGEAVANAVEHAYRDTTGDFVLRLSMSGDTILGEVEDLGTWRDAQPEADRGRGMAILQAATSRLELSRSPHGTTVAFAI